MHSVLSVIFSLKVHWSLLLEGMAIDTCYLPSISEEIFGMNKYEIKLLATTY